MKPLFRISAFLILLAANTACRQVVLRVQDMPSNTPKNAAVFVSGDFNHWNPSDGATRLEAGANGVFYVTLPRGMGKTGYKFTRGDWTTQEADLCGHDLNSRIIDYLSAPDTVTLSISSWRDLGPTHCNEVVLRIKALPKETPSEDSVYLAGNYNLWKAGNPKYRFNKMPDGTYQLKIEPRQEELEFKITRGSWFTEASDENGFIPGNSHVKLGLKDTIDLKVWGWRDIDAGLIEGIRNIYVHVPSNTPTKDALFIAGNFNKWKADDPACQLRSIAPNLYGITLNKGKGQLLFKFTRGSWDSEEYDFYGHPIQNRRLKSGPGEVHCTVDAWKDLYGKSEDNQTNSNIDSAHSVQGAIQLKSTEELRNEPLLLQRDSTSIWEAEFRKIRAEFTKFTKEHKNAIKPIELEKKIRALVEKLQKKERENFTNAVYRPLVFSEDVIARTLPQVPGHKPITIKVRDEAPFNREVYIRFQTPTKPSPTNYYTTIKPGRRMLLYIIPAGTFVYSLNGAKNEGNKVRERALGSVDANDDGTEFYVKRAVFSQPINP